MTVQVSHPRPTAAVASDRSRRLGNAGTLTFPELFELPTTVDMATAARAIGVSLGTAYRLARRRAFPCVVLRPGWRYRVPTAALLTALNIDLTPVHIDDVDQGVDFAARFA
jgi:hypothetical protein